MPVYDCFTFFNELDILEVRIEEMFDSVDVFVIAEAVTTHQGNAKPLIYHDNRQRFSRFNAKIRHIVVDEWPATNEPWVRERFQRNALRHGLTDVDPNSTIMISDVDEIMRPGAIQSAISRGDFNYFCLEMYLYYLNWHAGPWVKSYAAPFKIIEAMPDLSAPREIDPHQYLRTISADQGQIIDHAGWHFSWLGGVERMIAKLDAFAHTENSVQRWREPSLLAEQIASRRFFNDGTELKEVVVDGSFPESIRVRQRELARSGYLRMSRRPVTLPLKSPPS